jgi:glycosyltransferase involved in cell wall biosynthesis
MMRDLAQQFALEGDKVLVITTKNPLENQYRGSQWAHPNIRILRAGRPGNAHKNLVLRTFGEILLPFQMLAKFWLSKKPYKTSDLVICYAPSIFLTPVVYILKKKFECPSYLIVRDIFPAWAKDLGLIKSPIVLSFFEFFEKLQYLVADCIGVQSAGDVPLFKEQVIHKKIEVLNNWSTPYTLVPAKKLTEEAIQAAKEFKTILIYAGNVGVAQDYRNLLSIFEATKDIEGIGSLVIGRGSQLQELKAQVKRSGLQGRVYFFPEIEPEQLPVLYRHCDIGLVCLNKSHRTNNIPGKFISYLQYGLPIFALVNRGNDLVEILKTSEVGLALSSDDKTRISIGLKDVVSKTRTDKNLPEKCTSLSKTLFATNLATSQIKKIVS